MISCGGPAVALSGTVATLTASSTPYNPYMEEKIANCDSKHDFKYNSKPKLESIAKVT